MAAVAGMFGWVEMSEGTAAAAGEEGILPADTEQDRPPAGILLVGRLPEDKRKNLLLLGACMEERTAVLDCMVEQSEHSLKAWQTWQVSVSTPRVTNEEEHKNLIILASNSTLHAQRTRFIYL